MLGLAHGCSPTMLADMSLLCLRSSESKATGQGQASSVTLCPLHRVLGEAVLPFPLALAEVTLGIGRGRRVILRSYQDEEAGEGAGCGLGWAAGLGWEGLAPMGPGSSCSAPTGSNIKAMVTEMSIGEEDFQQLQAQEGVAVTFCLKEFRVSLSLCPSHPVLPALPRASTALPLPSQGLLSFAESANLSLSVHFDTPGR